MIELERTYDLGGKPSTAVLDLVERYGGTVVAGELAVFPSAWHVRQFEKALQSLHDDPEL